MVTLMTVGNSDGERRCDARCYDAQGGECDCICGGANHGKGYTVASQNVAVYVERQIENIATSKGITPQEYAANLGIRLREIQLGLI